MEILEAFRYCPRCGNDLKIKDNYLVCSSCGLNFFVNPKACTAVIIVDNDSRILLTKRALNPHKGSWDLPGGFVEQNETFEESARRELKEELGVILHEVYYIGSNIDLYEYQNITYPTLIVTFIAKMPANTVLKPDDDVADYKFFDIKSLPKDKIAFESVNDQLAAAIKFLATNKL